MCSFSSLTTIIDSKSQIIDIDLYLASRQLFSEQIPLGSMVLFSLAFVSVVEVVVIFGFAKLSMLSLTLFRLLICFSDHTLIPCQFMCSVYTLDISNSNPTRIMCKFVSFRKWPVILMRCQR